jgi:hypothetical protein
MTQYLVAIHLPNNFEPSLEDKAMEHDIDRLNEELDAAGARSRCGHSSMVRSSSPTGHTWRPRSTSAGSGYWKPLT